MHWEGTVTWINAQPSKGQDKIEKAKVDGSTFMEIAQFIEDFGEDVIVEAHIMRKE